MGKTGRASAVALAVALLLGPAIIASVTSGSTVDLTANAPSSMVQYSPSAQFSADTVFDNQSSVISVDPYARDFAIGDLNNDGRKDVAIISNKTDSICIYNRSADGALSSSPWRISKPGVVDLRSIAIGDLNNDGLNDIVVSYNDTGGNGYICIFNQTISGFDLADSFSKPVWYEPWQVVIGHFDRTNNFSVATVCMGDKGYPDDYIDIWRYPFTTGTRDRLQIPISASPIQFWKSRFLASGDVNNDGLSDLVVGNESGLNAFIALQPNAWKSSWAISNKPITGGCSDLQLARVMGSEHDDLVFADTANSKVLVFRNDGTSSHSGTGLLPNAEAAIRTPSGLGSVAIGEMSNGQGVDMLALSVSYSNASAFLRDSNSIWLGPYPNFTFPVGVAPRKAIIDDSVIGSPGVFVLSRGMNGRNGSLGFFNIEPILTGNSNENRFLGSGSPNFITEGKMANGDSVIASALTSNNQVVLYKKNGSVSRTLNSFSGPIAIAFGYFDSDGYEDMAVVNSISNKISLFNGSQLFTAAGPFMNITLTVSGANCIASGSIGEGLDDLVIGYDGGGLILYNKDDGSYFDPSFSEKIGTDVPGIRTAVSVGALNNDGYGDDVALLNSATNDIEVYLRNSSWSGSFFANTPTALLDALEPVSSFAMGDLGGSSAIDVAALGMRGKVQIFEQPSFGFSQDWVPDAQLDIRPNPSALNIGDLNDDGATDLIISYQGLPMMAAYLRTGSFTFKNSFNFTTGAIASSILASDIDGDRRCDIACTSPDSHSISIWYQNNLIPVGGIRPVPPAYEGNYVAFDGSTSMDSYSDVGSLNYSWSFGDGGMGYGRSTSHQYTDNGSYLVGLTVRDRGGLTNRTSIQVTILDKKPVVDFSWAPANPTEGQSVLFADLSTSSPDAIIGNDWYFSDTGEHKSGASVSHTFAQQGSYAVILSVTDDDSVNSTTKTVIVTDTTPTASFTENATSIHEGGSVQFTDLSTPGLGGEAVAYWNWTFGDGTHSNAKDPVHVYTDVGNFIVTLRVRDADDSTWTSSPSQAIDVADVPPIANFTWEPSAPLETRPVSFTDTSWHYAGDTLTNWTWSFGDGVSGYGQDVSHPYAEVGVYPVKLTVKDSDGSISSIIKDVTIQETTPIANFTFDPPWPIEGKPAYLNSTTTVFVPIAYYNWTVEGAPPMYGPGIVWTFDQAGSYQVTLRVTDEHGRYDSRTIGIEVHESNITVDFSWSGSPLEGQPVHFNGTADSYEPIVNWTWNLGNGTFSYGIEADRTFGWAGYYQVTLRVTDIDGTTADVTKTILVGETYPNASFTLWPTAPDEGAWVFFNDTSTPSPISGLEIIRWQWIFDGHYYNTTANAQGRFGDGRHTALLLVWDEHGVANISAVAEFDVADVPPAANFTWDNAVEGSPANFTSTSTVAWDQIILYNWSFGDGSSFESNLSAASHTYDMKGEYNVTLTVWDGQDRSSTWRFVNVESVPPKVELSVLGPSVEGQMTRFNLLASSFNRLVSWNWSYDGNLTWTSYQDAEAGTAHVFADNGNYIVYVNVTEADGDWTLASVRVQVQDTGPSVIRFWSASDEYYMDQNVSFWCTADATYRPITRYEWNFNYDNGGAWIASSPLLANHTSHTFTAPGTVFVMVRVWDDDSATEYVRAMQIEINDVRPVASFSFQESTDVSGRVLFDASLSSDSPSDTSSLQFSWNFGDSSGWSIFSASSRTTFHDFQSDSNYTVALKVMDQWGMLSSQTNHTVIIDRLPPTLVMQSTGNNATADQAIVITAEVNDVNGIKRVDLTYRIGNGSWIILPMVPTNQPDVYAGQIPAQPANTTVLYFIQATDSVNNTRTTQTFQIEVKPAVVENSGLLWIIALLAAIIVLLVLFIAFRPVPVDEVFIIYQDGRLMAHQTRRLKPGMDDEILSSMLVAIQSFVKDSFKDESATHLQRLDFGEKKILVERGDSFYLAVVLHSNRAGNVPRRMQSVVEDIHKDFGPSLKEWDGDLEKVRGIKDRTDKLLKPPFSLPGTSQRRQPEAQECPMCGFPLQPNAKGCPSCGTELSMSTVDDLESVAKGLEGEERKG